MAAHAAFRLASGDLYVSGGIRYARFEPWCLLIAVGGLAAVTLSGVGSYKPFVYVIALLVLIHAGLALRQGFQMPGPVRWLLLAPAVFLFCDLAAPDGIGDKNAARNLIAFTAVAAAVWLLPKRWMRPVRVYAALLGVLVAIALAHAVTVWLYLEPHGPMDNPRLLIHNPHFIALQAVVVATVAIPGLRQGGFRVRALASVGLVAALATLVGLPSLVGLVALVVSSVAVLLLRSPAPVLRAGLLCGAVLLAALLVFPTVAGTLEPTLTRVAEAAGFSRLDERVGIWRDAWELQLRTEGLAWVTGHGLGAFEAHFADVWVFPHNFFLEVLYNSGIVGLGAFIAASGALAVAFVRGLAAAPDGLRLLALALLIGVVVFTFLTLPLTARVTTHALGVTVGLSLWALKARD